MAKKPKSPRKSDSSPLEHARGENRKLRKEVAVLRKELSKSLHYTPKTIESVVPEEELEDETHCPKCSHKLKFIQLPNKDVILCPNCSYRSILKKDKE